MKKIKFVTLLVVIAFTTTVCFAQEKEMNYLFGEQSKIKVTGFLGPIMEFSLVGNEFSFFAGGGGGILVNQTFLLGGYGEGLTSVHYLNVNEYQPENGDEPYSFRTRMDFGHAGFWLGYIHKAVKPIHFAFTSKFGWGTLELKDTDDKPDSYSSDDFRDNVFVIIPQIEADFNFTKWMKMNIGAGSRFVTGVDKKYQTSTGLEPVFDKNDLNKPQLTLSFFFGNFK